MTEAWVVNASPIITLAKAGYLHLLEELAPTLQVPEPVVRELLAGDPADPARQAMQNGWGSRLAIARIPDKILEWGLGSGESAVLAAASALPAAVAIVDDAEARKCARALGITVMGTLGVVVRAKHRQLIPSATEVVQALTKAGLYLDPKTIRETLEAIGEEAPVKAP